MHCFSAGSRLQLLKKQLQKQMKVKRAEIRMIQESQRKLDNEEMSEEEEEMTDEEGTCTWHLLSNLENQVNRKLCYSVERKPIRCEITKL